MPIYTYQVVNEDGSPGETFELIQRIIEPPLTEQPGTGKPVRRLFGAPNIGGTWSESASRDRISDKNLEKHGFTKYQRVGKGHYERRAGNQGPSQISVD